MQLTKNGKLFVLSSSVYISIVANESRRLDFKD